VAEVAAIWLCADN